MQPTARAAMAGCLLCWMMVRMWVEWIPALARDRWLLRARAQLAAAPRAEHFRTFPVEMPLAACTRLKYQAGKRNRKGTASQSIDLTTLCDCIARDLPAASFCSQHLRSFAPIPSGHVLPLAGGQWRIPSASGRAHAGTTEYCTEGFGFQCLDTRACSQAT